MHPRVTQSTMCIIQKQNKNQKKSSNFITFKLHWKKNLKHTICSLCYWHNCDLATESMSSYLVSVSTFFARLESRKVGKKPLKQCPKKKRTLKGFFLGNIRKSISYLPWIQVQVKSNGIFVNQLMQLTITLSLTLIG